MRLDVHCVVTWLGVCRTCLCDEGNMVRHVGGIGG